MKKIIYLFFALLVCSCGPKKTYSYSPGSEEETIEEVDTAQYVYRTYCPADSASNHTHQFSIENYYPTNLLNEEGWFCEVCHWCGQEFMFNNDFECSKQSGTVCAFRSPETGQFTDFCVCYQDEDGGFRYRTVSRQDLSYRPQGEGDDEEE